MVRESIVWKKSIYDNDYKCSCGAKLFDRQTMKPTENLGVDKNHQNRCYCMKCKNLVAVVKPYEGDGEGEMGHWKGDPVWKE